MATIEREKRTQYLVRGWWAATGQRVYYSPSRKWRTLTVAEHTARRFGSRTEAKRAKKRANAEHGDLGFEIITAAEKVSYD